MLMSQSNLVKVALTCVTLAFLTVQLKCDDLHPEKIFDKELDDLFQDDKDLKKEITSYLEKVPSSHRSRSAASRILGDYGKDGKKNSNVSMLFKPRNKIKRVVAIIFTQRRRDCSRDCGKCPPVKECGPCPPPDCQDCPICPLPDYCKPAAPGQKCPPEPQCPVCEDEPSTTSRPVTTTSKPTTTSSAKPSTTTSKAPPSTTTKAPPSTTTKAPSTTTTRAATTTTSTTRASTTVSGKRIASKTTSKANLNSTSNSVKRGNSSSCCGEVPADILNELSMILVAEQGADSNSNMTSNMLVITTTTTRVPSTSAKPADDEYIKNSSSTIKIKKNKNSKTVTKTKSTFSNGTTTESETTTEETITGEFLFEKNINMLVTNETMRNQIRKMVNCIPQKAGGEELKIAKKLLHRFGSKKTTTVRVKGSSRMCTFMHAKRNIKEIIGFLLDRFRRKKCACSPCPLSPPCACKKQACPPKKPKKCPSCPSNPQCPVPDGCKAYPACKKCPDESVNYDGNDPKELNDVDMENPIKDGELDKPQKCKGFACKFEDKCGVADLNPLTPKASQTGYMNGGENEVYGEWPSFVRLETSDPDNGLRSALCGGVLISDRHVLTAAHCVIQDSRVNITAEKIKVHLAEHEKEKEDKYEKIVKVKSICRSPKFVHNPEEGNKYDYSVLELAEPVKFNDYIQPACLPYKPIPLTKKTKCFVVGLGIEKFNQDPDKIKMSMIVQKMALKRATCRSWGFKHDDRSRHCFTKAVGKGDTCTGDSGGPILCLNRNNRWTVMGLVSYGSEACDGTESTGWVGVYTRVQALLNQLNMDCKV